MRNGKKAENAEREESVARRLSCAVNAAAREYGRRGG